MGEAKNALRRAICDALFNENIFKSTPESDYSVPCLCQGLIFLFAYLAKNVEESYM